MLAVVRGLPRFDARSNLTTWIYRVSTNACLDELRRRKRRPVPGLPMVEQPAPGDIGSAVVARAVVDRALHDLPEEYRVAVVLRDLCNLDYDEIAEVLGIPPGTVRSRIARGRMSLARSIGNQTPHDERQTDSP